jgi:adenylate cyclase
MRFGFRFALSALVLTCIGVSGLLVHALWHRTADSNSRELIAILDKQIADAVRKEVAERITSAEAAFGAIRTIFVQDVIDVRQADKREFVFLSQIQAQPQLSWIAFGWPDTSFFASHKLGDANLEMTEITVEGRVRTRRIDRYKVFPDDIEFEDRSFEPNNYLVTDQPWYRNAIGAEGPDWSVVTDHPNSKRAAIAFSGPLDVRHKRQGVLVTMIELDRLSRFLGTLDVARTGAAFIFAPDGHIVAGPDKNADEVIGVDLSTHPLLGVARQIGNHLVQQRESESPGPPALQINDNGIEYAVTMTPLGFQKWTVAVIVPVSEFLGPIERTRSRLAFTLLLLAAIASLISVLVANRILIEPLRAVVGDFKFVEDFELNLVLRRKSRLHELDALSSSLVHMVAGLTAFAKYIPADLVRALVDEGVEAKLGGASRPLTILFADIPGFTGISERLGNDVVPLVGAFLDLASQAIEREGGTIDKFIGDAVMAFWGAPRSRSDHAVAACKAALLMLAALAESKLSDDAGKCLAVRVGINSGIPLVGNIGSHARFNYTAIGDAVNLASRLEGANKIYGTQIILGVETRRLAGDEIIVRELDRIAVFGRSSGISIFELVGLAGDAKPSWIAVYEAGLAHYRERHWDEAERCFWQVLAVRGDDGPSRLMVARCKSLREQPPTDNWEPITVMETK